MGFDEESPEVVHRVALEVGAMIECQKWVRRSLELRRSGKRKASERACGNARMFLELIVDIQRGAGLRRVDAAALKLVGLTVDAQRTHRSER